MVSFLQIPDCFASPFTRIGPVENKAGNAFYHLLAQSVHSDSNTSLWVLRLPLKMKITSLLLSVI